MHFLPKAGFAVQKGENPFGGVMRKEVHEQFVARQSAVLQDAEQGGIVQQVPAGPGTEAIESWEVAGQLL